LVGLVPVLFGLPGCHITLVCLRLRCYVGCVYLVAFSLTVYPVTLLRWLLVVGCWLLVDCWLRLFYTPLLLLFICHYTVTLLRLRLRFAFYLFVVTFAFALPVVTRCYVPVVNALLLLRLFTRCIYVYVVYTLLPVCFCLHLLRVRYRYALHLDYVYGLLLPFAPFRLRFGCTFTLRCRVAPHATPRICYVVYGCWVVPGWLPCHIYVTHVRLRLRLFAVAVWLRYICVDFGYGCLRALLLWLLHYTVYVTVVGRCCHLPLRFPVTHGCWLVIYVWLLFVCVVVYVCCWLVVRFIWLRCCVYFVTAFVYHVGYVVPVAV